MKTAKHTQFVDVTSEIEKIVSRHGQARASRTFFIRTTAAIVINENEVGLLSDYEALLEKLLKFLSLTC